MNDRLDRALQSLKHQPIDVGLGAVEASVWQRLDGARDVSGAPTSIFAVRAATVVAFLCLGFAAGGVTAASARVQPNEISVFSVGTELAPSTLLEGQ